MRTTTLAAAGLLGLALLVPTGAGATPEEQTCLGQPATIIGTTLSVTGTEDRDVIVSGSAREVLALGGDDVVCMTADGDSAVPAVVDAGDGDDSIVLDPAAMTSGSRLDAGAGQDRLWSVHDERLALNLRRERVIIDGRTVGVLGLEAASLMAPVLSVLGDDADNSFSFAGCEASLRGGAGRDELVNVPEVYFRAAPLECETSAVLGGGPGPDYVRGTYGDDVVRGGPGRDKVHARAGEDRVRGNGGHDELEGGRGDDDVRGGAGRDSVHGSQGRDLCRAEDVRHCER